MGHIPHDTCIRHGTCITYRIGTTHRITLYTGCTPHTSTQRTWTTHGHTPHRGRTHIMHNTHATHVLTVHMGRARHSRGPSGRLDAIPLWPAQCPCARKAPGSDWGAQSNLSFLSHTGHRWAPRYKAEPCVPPKGPKGCSIQALSRAPLLSSGPKGGRRGPCSTGNVHRKQQSARGPRPIPRSRAPSSRPPPPLPTHTPAANRFFHRSQGSFRPSLGRPRAGGRAGTPPPGAAGP